MRRHEESEHQIALIQWWDHACRRWRAEPRDLYAVPNGGRRGKREAAIMKGEGVRAGQPDLNLDVAVGSYHGLRIEMKRPDREGRRRAQPSVEQRERLKLYNERGYATAVCRGWIEARDVITAYLDGTESG